MVSTFALTSVEYSASGNVGNIMQTICLLDGKCTTWSRLDGILAVQSLFSSLFSTLKTAIKVGLWLGHNLGLG